jgi:23S rRNA (cytosine1962-C5)-methyltransferase
MKTSKLILRNKGLERVRAGHPWIYRSQVKEMPSGIEQGSLVEVFAENNRWIGWGHVNPASEIIIRLLSRGKEALQDSFFRKRLEKARQWRKEHIKKSNAVRWVHSEADGLPGLILDEYNGYMVIQTTTAGMELKKPVLVKFIQELFQPRGIYEKNDFASREYEKLPLLKSVLAGENPPELIEIQEGNCKFWVDIQNGHKTGFYLDQKDNRAVVSSLSGGKKVLDCFTYTGGFALAALTGGAQKVTAVDISGNALNLARKNAELNGVLNRWEDCEANGFDYLKGLQEKETLWDMIILDPPSFTKSRSHVEQALRGYKEINLRALKSLKEGGILVTASCSHHISPSYFEEVIREAAGDAKKTLTLMHRGMQSLDHPVVLSIPETEYLQCLFFRVESFSH